MTAVAADALFDAIADGAARESPLWADALLAPGSREAVPVFSLLLSEPRFALGIVTIYEGYLLHYGRARLFAPADEDIALLLGDTLLAHGLVRIAETGSTTAVGDVAALLSVLGAAVGSARAGDGPHLVEAHTYRVQAHTNADDPSRYRSDDEVAPWIARDPITRVETYLRGRGLIDDQKTSGYVRSAEKMAEHMRAGLHRDEVADYRDLFAHVYAEPTPQLREQQALIADELSREEAR